MMAKKSTSKAGGVSPRAGKSQPHGWDDLFRIIDAASKVSPPAGKSQSARARPHDWDDLFRIVDAASKGWTHGLDWDEHYVHALQRALVGRDNGPLLQLLEEGRLLQPALYPALADVVRSQRDGARGAGKALTRQQDRMIRDLFDRVGPHLHPAGHPGETHAWLASAFDTSVATIKRSLKDTEPKAK